MRSSSRRPTLFAAGAVAAIVGMLVATTPVPHASAATKKTTVKKAVTTKASIKAASNKTASKVKAAPVTTKPDPDKAQFIPGRPWTALIPDPDTFDWNRTNRPGYRLRPMNTVQQNFRNYIKDDEGTNFNLNPFHPSTIDLSGFAKSIMFS